MKKYLTLICAILLTPSLYAETWNNPADVWKDVDPDAGDFNEEIILEEERGGVLYRNTYISAYVLGEEIRVYVKYAVKKGAQNVPGLFNVHGWMGAPAIDNDYVNDGWAVLSFDYCGDNGSRQEYTKYPESLRYGNMDGKIGYRVKSKLPDGSQITNPNQTDDYLWYAVQRRALSYFLTQPEVDKTRIGAKGYSYGGTIMWNIATDPRIKAMVAYFGVGYLEYYRTRSVWMYNNPPTNPPKSSGEKLYLSTIAPQAHAPYITAASLWLNGTNDHHGGHERGEQIFRNFKKGVPWDYALQARGHHNTEKLGNDSKYWLEKYVLGIDHFWPKRPVSKLKLDSEGVPEFFIKPDAPDKIKGLKIYYALKNPVSFSRAWRDTKAAEKNGIWSAKLPVLNVDDYVFAYANVRYENDVVISSEFEAAIPSQIGNAVATDDLTKRDDVTSRWSNVAPVEGVGGVQGFRPMNNRWGTKNEMLTDPKYQAPKGSKLKVKFYCTQPQSLLLKAGHFVMDFEVTASNDWQERVIAASELVNRKHNFSLSDWSQASVIAFAPKPGADITKVIFAEIEWIAGGKAKAAKPEAKVALKADAQGRSYLSIESASSIQTFHVAHTDKSFNGEAISVGGQKFEKGLGVHAESDLTYSLDGSYKTFHVVPGADNAQHGFIEMKILVDGEEKFTTGKIKSSNRVIKPVVVSVEGAKSLRLRVHDADGSPGGDHASWADAYLMK